MNIGIMDGELLGRKSHRFPNLACMKLSGYFKGCGHNVQLITDTVELERSTFDQLYLSKVFIATQVPVDVLHTPNLICGGTGFFYDKAPALPEEMEHHRPDYHLYDEWVSQQLSKGIRRNALVYYTDYSIGFTTRGCFRGCSFCVNKNYRASALHSPVDEFIDPSRKFVTLLDDNVLACRQWKEVFHALQRTGKAFQFKQGCDERLLTDEMCKEIFCDSRWVGDRIFAFDNIADADLIEKKLKLIRSHTSSVPKFYCLCGYNHTNPGQYPDAFWKQDILDLFRRIELLFEYRCLPYIMRYADYSLSPYRDIYVQMTRWCNQPSFAKKTSFEEFCTKVPGQSKRVLNAFSEFRTLFPEDADHYAGIRFGSTRR